MGKRRVEIIEKARNLPQVRDMDEGLPLIHKAQGARLFDVDNVGYIDYTGGDGSAIVGHANQYISDAVKKALTTGVPGGFHPPTEVDLAESLEHFVAWVKAWFFFRDEDDALATTLDWAKTKTERDQLLFVGGGRGAVARRNRKDARVVAAWDIEAVEVALTAGAAKIAAVVVDPVVSGRGVLQAPDGSLERIGTACRQCNVPLIFDDRTAGFRVSRGGTVEWSGVTPDIAVLGGALGGGLPIGAVGFAEAELDGEPVGLKSDKAPHPVAVRAAEAVLSILKNDAVFERLEERCIQLTDGMAALATRFNRPLQFNRIGSMFAVYASRDPVTGEAEAEASDEAEYKRLASALRDEGVLLPPMANTAAFVSSAHGAKDIEETIGAFERVLMRLHQEDLP